MDGLAQTVAMSAATSVVVTLLYHWAAEGVERRWREWKRKRDHKAFLASIRR